MNIGWKAFIRVSIIFAYVTVFLGVYLGLYVYLGNTVTVQDSRAYNEENKPEYFPILIAEQGDDGLETLSLRSLSLAEYSSVSIDQSWHLYQLVKGEAGATHRLANVDGVAYKIQHYNEEQVLVEVSVNEANQQRVSTYTYKIEDDRVYPSSYLLSSSFGHNFSPLPFLFMLTGILIYLSEKFLVKRLLR